MPARNVAPRAQREVRLTRRKFWRVPFQAKNRERFDFHTLVVFSRAQCRMRRARDCYGLASMVQLLRAATCSCLADEKLEAILKRHSYGVDAAAAALLDGEDLLTKWLQEEQPR